MAIKIEKNGLMKIIEGIRGLDLAESILEVIAIGISVVLVGLSLRVWVKIKMAEMEAKKTLRSKSWIIWAWQGLPGAKSRSKELGKIKILSSESPR